MADNTLQNGTALIATDEITQLNGVTVPAVQAQRVKVIFGSDGIGRDIDPSNPLPVSFPSGKNTVTIADTQADIHGQLVEVTRISQISTKFFQQAPSSFLTVTVSGGATATGPTAGAGVFSTSTAVTAALLAQTPVGILYAAQYEAWAVLSGAYTTPTSAASFQRLGIYDATNGYSVGYNGLTFGLWVRVNSVDTFIAQTAWNKDVLNGAATSLFTSNNAPVALVPTNMNMFRIRFGWYGGVSAFFEVYAPDGHWIIVHQVRTANSQIGVNITMPDLPMTVEVNKTASDATNLSITCGGWAAGITAPSSGANLGGQKSIAALNAAVNIPVSGIGELSFAISGTWVATLSFQSSLDGLTWIADSALNSITKTFATSTTINGTFKAAVSSNRFYRLIATAFTSGSTNISYSGSNTNNFVISQSLITDSNNGPVTVKPASTAAVAADMALVVALHPTTPLPAGTASIGTVQPPAITKGTQGTVGITTQDLKDAGRNLTTYFMALPIVTTAADALVSLTSYKNGAAVTAATTPAVVTTGKTLNITSVHINYLSVATGGGVRISLRANTAGLAALASPVVQSWFVGGPTSATAGLWANVSIPLPDGLEFAAGTGLAVSIVGISATGVAAAAGYATASITGYEY